VAKIKRILKKRNVEKQIVKIARESDCYKIIESITFYDSICAIKKYSSPKVNQFKSVITGNENIGGVPCFKNELDNIENVRKMFE